MYKTYLLGNGGYAQECFEQFVLGGVIQDFGGFLILKNNKLVIINEEGVDDFKYLDKSSFVLGTGHRIWRKKFFNMVVYFFFWERNRVGNLTSRFWFFVKAIQDLFCKRFFKDLYCFLIRNLDYIFLPFHNIIRLYQILRFCKRV